MAQDEYLLYDDSIEVIQPDEKKLIDEIVASVEKSGHDSFAIRSHATRRQHAKSHGILKGELQIYDNLPDHLRQGLFATPRTYPIIVRLSTIHGESRTDNAPAPRGFAIKVFGVEGPKALEEDQSANHDFLLTNRKAFFPDVGTYTLIQQWIEKDSKKSDSYVILKNRLANLLYILGIRSIPLVQTFADPNHNILGETFSSLAPIRFGKYVTKITVAPYSEAVKSLTGTKNPRGDNAIREFVVNFFKNNDAEYELRAQLAKNLQQTPIEDASVVWPEELTPHQPIARIILPRQDVDSPGRRAYADDVLTFTPWRCLVEHRPLGSIMRLRRHAYKLSSDLRHKINARPLVEPSDISELPS